MRMALPESLSLGRWLGADTGAGRLLNPTSWTKKTQHIVLIVAIALAVALGGFVNYQLYASRAALQRQIEADERALSTLPSVRRQIEDVRNERIRLVTERDRLFATVPDLTNIPFILQQVEQLGRLSGGRVLSLDYSPTKWNENRSEVIVHLRFQGSFYSILTFAAGINDSFPTAQINQMALDIPVATDPSTLELDTTLRISVLETRPEEYPVWDRTQLFARNVAPLPSPFEPPLGDGTSFGLDLSNWKLEGIVDHKRNRMALVKVNAVSHIFRAGDVLDEVVVIAIGDTYVRVQRDGQEDVLRLGGER